MILDDKITFARIKKEFFQIRTLWQFFLCIVISCLFFVTLNNLQIKPLTIWENGTIVDCYLSKELEQKLKTEASNFDYNKVNFMILSSEDQYYGAAFSTKGMYQADFFILNYDETTDYANSSIFAELSEEAFSFVPSEKLYYQDGAFIGIILEDDKYLLVNKKSKLNEVQLSQLAKIIITYGKE